MFSPRLVRDMKRILREKQVAKEVEEIGSIRRGESHAGTKNHQRSTQAMCTSCNSMMTEALDKTS